MISVKAYVKKFFYMTGLAPIFDKLLYWKSKALGYKSNKLFQAAHHQTPLPPDYFLYETYKLDYKQYMADGDVTAREIMDWTNPYQKTDAQIILEWGCGVSRIIRHIHKYTSSTSQLFACDINDRMIGWNKENIANIQFATIESNPPTNYPDDHFNLVYGISVLTHIENTMQERWLREIHRILKPAGIFLFTTHGDNYFHQLLPKEKKLLKESGSFTRSFPVRGHRLMTTYNDVDTLTALVCSHFQILQYWNGRENLNKVGGQDLWIVKK